MDNYEDCRALRKKLKTESDTKKEIYDRMYGNFRKNPWQMVLRTNGHYRVYVVSLALMYRPYCGPESVPSKRLYVMYNPRGRTPEESAKIAGYDLEDGVTAKYVYKLVDSAILKHPPYHVYVAAHVRR